ncbi:MAG: alpha/beta hydrolase [Hyphomicrobium sp.]|nr:alpha/beta hydrolase [Hyphomicrobium sp.]
MAFVTVNGLNFHTQVLKTESDRARPAVVMVHGLTANLAAYYCTIANGLAQVADVYLYDQRGHGLTEMPTSGYGESDYVADLRGLLDSWGLDEPIHLVSNSFGGITALAFARDYPTHVASLVLIESLLSTEGLGDHLARELAAWLQTGNAVPGYKRDGVAVHRKLARQKRQWGRLIRKTSLLSDISNLTPFATADLKAISCPALAIYGSSTPVIDHIRILERYVAKFDLHVIEGAGHSIMVDRSSEVEELIRDRLADQSTLVKS